jgi:hypothetical protein
MLLALYHVRAGKYEENLAGEQITSLSEALLGK